MGWGSSGCVGRGSGGWPIERSTDTTVLKMEAGLRPLPREIAYVYAVIYGPNQSSCLYPNVRPQPTPTTQLTSAEPQARPNY